MRYKKKHVSWFVVALLAVLVPISQAAAVTVTTLVSDPSLSPGSITTDGTTLYFGNGGGPANILTAPVGGGSFSTLYAGATPCCVVALTLAGSNLFWIDPNGGPITDTTISKAPKGGGGPITRIYVGAFVGQPIVDGEGVTTDGTKLYTSDAVQGRVHSLNLDGSGITFLGSRYGGFFNTEHSTRITQSGGILYIVDSGGATPGGTFTPAVLSIPATGGSFTTLASGAPLIDPIDIAVKDGTIFLADPGADTIWELPIGGGTPTALVSGGPFVSPAALTLAGDRLFVADPGAHAIFRVDVPEPSTLFLLVAGLAGLGAAAWRRHRWL